MEDLFKTNESEVETTENVVELTDELAENHESAEESVEDTEKETENEKKPKEDKLNAYEKVILAEMERRAKGEDGDMPDDNLADGLASKDKNIHACYQYVVAQARKKAVGQCAMIEDSVVYGWAHHYYIEPKEVIDAELHPKPKEKPKTDTKTATTPSPTKSKEKPKTETKPKKKGSYADNPLLKSIMEKNKGKGKSKTITTNANGDRVEEVKGGNGKIYKITEFSLF